MKRGQAAIEYVLLIGLLLLFLVPIIQFSLIQTHTELRLSQLDDSFIRLSKAADAVGALGIGAQEIVTITIPSGMESITFEDNAISIQISMGGGIQDMGYNTLIDITGEMPIDSGTYRLKVIKQHDSLVNMTLWEN